MIFFIVCHYVLCDYIDRFRQGEVMLTDATLLADWSAAAVGYYVTHVNALTTAVGLTHVRLSRAQSVVTGMQKSSYIFIYYLQSVMSFDHEFQACLGQELFDDIILGSLIVIILDI